jgi:hypothetical protein
MARRHVLWYLPAAAIGILAMSCVHSWAADSIEALSTFSNSQTVWGIRTSALVPRPD